MQIARGEKGNAAGEDRPHRERSFERNRISLANERLPFQSIAIQMHVPAILVEQGQDSSFVPRNAPKAGKNGRQELFQFEAGTEFPTDRDQALLFLQGAVGFFLLQRQRSHQRDAREEFDVLAFQNLVGSALAQAKGPKTAGRRAHGKDGVRPDAVIEPYRQAAGKALLALGIGNGYRLLMFPCPPRYRFIHGEYLELPTLLVLFPVAIQHAIPARVVEGETQ